MTVRVSKSKFNLREKLSELDIPVGSHGTQLMKSANASESFSLVGAGRKNMIINGQCWINQRNGTSSYTIPNATGGSYGGPDRWAINEATGGSVSVNMDGDPPNQPLTGVGQFQKAMQIACSGADTSMGSTENLHFFQNIEGYNMSHLQWGTVAAKDVTLSFWVKTNKAGTYCVGLENNGTDRCCIREYYQTGNSIWNKVVLKFPGCIDGTWLNSNDCGIRVRFCLASGTQYDDGVVGSWVTTDELTAGNQTNFMDSTNNRFFITGVQFEEGNIETPFEHRSYGEELALCQRYFTYIPAGTVFAGRGNSTASYMYSYSTPVPLRANPNVGKSDDIAHGTFSIRRYRDSAGVSDSTNTPTTNSTYFQPETCMISLSQDGFTAVDDRSATLFISGGAITLDAEL